MDLGYWILDFGIKEENKGVASSFLTYVKNGRPLCFPKCSIPTQMSDLDNNARFRYQLGYWFRLIDASRF